MTLSRLNDIIAMGTRSRTTAVGARAIDMSRSITKKLPGVVDKTPNTGPYIPPADLSFDFANVELGVVPDISGNGHQGMLSGGAAIGAGDGVTDPLSFLDVSSSGYVPTTWTRDGATKCTVTAWFKRTILVSSDRCIFGDARNSTSAAYMRLSMSTDATNYRYWTGDGYGASFAQSSIGGWTRDVWTHVAMVRDGTVTRLYSQGVKIYDVDVGFSMPPVEEGTYRSGVMTIGRLGEYDSSIFQFRGLMGPFRIYKGHALDETQVAHLATGFYA